MPDFYPHLGQPAFMPGLVLQVGENPTRYLRLTHVFEEGVYAMWVSDAENARYARRPQFLNWTDLANHASEPKAVWGRLVLPASLSTQPEPESLHAHKLKAAWDLINPLIKAFEKSSNLSRQNFTALIREHASRTSSAQRSLLRMVLRYYYFGRSIFALLPLPPGSKQGENEYPKINHPSLDSALTAKRRGRQAILSDELGPNHFVVSQSDIEDMTQCYKRLLRKGPTNKTVAHEEYLAGEFKFSHPAQHKEYIEGRAPEPVTYRQYCYYLDTSLKLNEDLERNVRHYRRNPGNLGSLEAAGPAEIYEIDSTGGRLFLVSSDKEPVVVGKPNIYLLIDRWSRFVPSAYIALRPPSYEEVRHMLLIAFTSREARFTRIGTDISDERWPVGRIPAVICPDRGSDFMSGSMEQSVVSDLRIDLTPLPPLCPDGKAIVERLIRTIKQRMAASGMEGVYADRPLDPRSKRAARKAEAAAVHTLATAYRALIEIICDHNNRPHSVLKRNKLLVQHGIEPTPTNAYLWGLKNISGLRSAPLSDEDYYRFLLSSDKASIANGVLRYKNRSYVPTNDAAFDFAKRSTRKVTSIDIRLDKTLPTEIYIPNRHGGWAKFSMTPGDAKNIMGISLDEEEALADSTSRLWARAEHAGRVRRVAAKSAKRSLKRGGSTPAVKVSQAEQQMARNRETAALKNQLNSTLQDPSDSSEIEPKSPKNWVEVEQEERQRNLEIIKRHRRNNEQY